MIQQIRNCLKVNHSLWVLWANKPMPYLFQRQPWKMHDKLHSSVNMLCHCEMILIHGYVSIAKQLANLKVSEILFLGFCYFLLQKSSAINWGFFSFFSLKFFVESEICHKFFGNNFLSYVNSCQKRRRAVLVTNIFNIMNNSYFC